MCVCVCMCVCEFHIGHNLYIYIYIYTVIIRTKHAFPDILSLKFRGTHDRNINFLFVNAHY